uniref:RING-type E3 ubiquitin transferase n=1 Tax=Physcomitrium patens TaxID=3218 RepID=A0A2K1L8Z6_PHYPA|nr:hypothetical protein PHYPA_000908 [Physcomitrium patens]
METIGAYRSDLDSNLNSFSKATNTSLAAQHNNTQGSMVPKGKFNPLLAVVITSLVLAFFLLGLISGRLRRWVWRFETEGGAVIRSSDTRTRTPKALHYGLDRQVVEALPLVQYRDLPADEQVEKYIDCSVCLVAFDATDTLRLLPICSHAFHSNCIDEWFLSHITCPLCRVCLAHSTDHAATEAVGQLPPHDDRIRSPEDSDVVEVVIGGDGELDSTTNTTILETSQGKSCFRLTAPPTLPFWKLLKVNHVSDYHQDNICERLFSVETVGFVVQMLSGWVFTQNHDLSRET